MMSPLTRSNLILSAGARVCAIARDDVIEVMRALPIASVAGAPPFVLGLSVVRGAPIPVVDLGALIGAERSAPTRFVALRLGDRRAALAVEAVLGVRDLDVATFGGLPPLLKDSDADIVDAIGMLDERLLFLLDAGRIVPDQVWRFLAEDRA